MADQSYRVNEPSVVAEVLDGEVIVVDLDSGNYYALADAAADAWAALDAGASTDRCIAWLGTRYTAPDGVIDQRTRGFVQQLEDAGLVVPEPGRTADELPPPIGDPQPFPELELKPYVELQNLIQLDPILEQDEQGWPLADERP